MRWAVAALPLVCSFATALGAQTTDCATCHPAEAKLHAQTRMAHAMSPALSSAFVQNLPQQPLRESGDGYAFTYQTSADGVSVTAARGTDQATGLIEWVLGAGAQGQTPLVRTADAMRESRVSYFPQLHQYGITVGQDGGASPDAQAALGLKESGRDLQACIGCHSSAITRDLQPVVPGVQCNRCHIGSEDHARGNGKLPSNPGKLTPPEQVRFCGNCHRNKPPVDDAQLENIRFQPLRLMKSRCFASGKLACTTCHVAHQDARRNDPAFYNAKCHACHDAQAISQAGTRATERPVRLSQPGTTAIERPVPFHTDQRQTGDCIGCHMPYVELHPALHFTDHFIRVVKAGDLPASRLKQRGSGS
ncbi:MAG TPA: multiheme c-type cytochrome [Bryobacteraceae bacterium]|nr:multiheme c-type cytochrome [Bryobacteraceae bacterium]